MENNKHLIQTLLNDAGYETRETSEGYLCVETDNVRIFISSLFEKLSYLTGDQLLSAMNELNEAFEKARAYVTTDGGMLFYFHPVTYIKDS